MIKDKNGNPVTADVQDAIEIAARTIESADALIIMAGAGLGVDSGFPDYRGNEGLWRAYPPLKHLGISFEEMANPKWFEKEPKLAWGFYGHRQKLYRETKPHHGYTLLKAWSEAMPQGHFVYTSNVDGHFHSTGFPVNRLVECHGNIHRLQCCEPCHDQTWQDSPKDLAIDLNSLQAKGSLPSCPECNGMARPNVMMFSDWDWIRDVTVDQLQRYNTWIDELRLNDARVAVLEIGAGNSLPAIRRESERQCSQLNARLIRINPHETDGPEGAIAIPLRAIDALKGIDSATSDEFTKKCGEIQTELSKPTSQATLGERMAAFFRLNPGGVVSTLPGDHLEVLKSRKVYGVPCKVTLPNGWAVWVQRLEMQRTYGGMIEGMPAKGHVQGYLREALADADKGKYRARKKVIEPKLYDSQSGQPVIPALRFIAQIESHERRNEDEDGTWLTLIWFADIDDEKSIKDYVSEALEKVDWEQDADSSWI